MQHATRTAVLQLALLLAHTHAASFDVRSYGGVGDGVTLNTKAFAAAVAAAHASYVDTQIVADVLVTNGVYLSGAVQLLSGVHLRVDAGATFLASSNSSDYSTDEKLWACVYSLGAQHVGIIGNGTLEGNFRRYVAPGYNTIADQYNVAPWTAGGCKGECRPRLVKFMNSLDVLILGVTIQGSPDWTIHILNCSVVLISGITQIGDPRWPNNDGCDIDSSQHVLIEHSSFSTGDDAICIKGSEGYLVYNITVRNTTVQSRSSGIKFGTACPYQMSSLLFENITVTESHRALALQARDGGLLTDIIFRNITIEATRLWPFEWWGAGEAIQISTAPRTATTPSCTVQNVLFEDINILASQNAAVILSGRAPGNTLRNITLRRITAVIDRLLPSFNYSTASSPAVPPTIMYDPSTVFSPSRRSMAGWMPGVFVEGVEGLTLDSVSVAFNNAHAQSYWGTECFNFTAAGYPVSTVNCSCVAPAR